MLLAFFVMSLSTTMALSFAEFAAKPFVQQAVAAPMRASSVLSFFYGVDLMDGSARDDSVQRLRDGEPVMNMQDIWYQGGEAYDDLCKNFAPAVRAACEKESDLQVDDGLSDVDLLTARMVLCDQIARNAFRGDPEAFRYDSVAEDLAMTLTSHALSQCEGIEEEEALSGEVYPPYLMSCILPLMHSESMASHERGKEVVDWAADPSNKYVPDPVRENFEFTRGFLLDHTKVIERFGRYPHRNKAYGRESTSEEQEWLNNVDELPAWAKSQ